MTKTFPVSDLTFMIISLLQILVKKLISLILCLQNSAQLLKIKVFPPWSTHPIIDQYLANIEFTKDGIKRIISKLDPNKAHGYHQIGICMLKMFGDAIIKPLFTVFKNCLILVWVGRR